MSGAGMPPRRRAAVVVNPTKASDPAALREEFLAHMHAAGWAEPLWLETLAEDPGAAMAREAVRAGVDVVLAYGGDGTVVGCVTGLAGTGVALGVLPVGTGNLLARNLGLPLDIAGALDVALTGTERSLDVGRLEREPHDGSGVEGEDTCFVVMAGMGFDAAVMADAPAALKARIGWPAYLVSGLRHLRDRSMRLTLSIDGGPPLRRRARTVVVGNVGALQAGMRLLPDARPDDGLFDVAVVAPGGLLDWFFVAGRVLRGRRSGDRRLEHLRGRRVELRATAPQQRQLDGDVLEPGTAMTLVVDPGALLVRVPGDGHPRP